LAGRTRAIAPVGMPCEAVESEESDDDAPLEAERAVDETAKTAATANPARLRNPFRLVVGSLSMRRIKTC
jgi:hypothetical protein